MNECQQNPCKNGGVCNNVVGSYVCTCSLGFKGKDCSEGKEFLNLRSGIPSFTYRWIKHFRDFHLFWLCIVRYFYYDLKINNLHNYYSFSADINECLQNPCSNSVTCQNVPGSYTCVCNSGWTGQDCDIGEFMANSVIWLIQMCDFEFVVLRSINCFANMSTCICKFHHKH